MKAFHNLIIASSMLLAGHALAQEWPAKPIRFLNPNAAGGLGELVTRFIAPVVEPRLGQRLIV
jgi:tripartite-type tricarboxylate transporter receptor subunit TctC